MSDTSEVENFSFDLDTHTYRNGAGSIRPSVTQILQSGGLFDYSRINPEVLERKRRIGEEVHAWAATHDGSNRQDGDLCDLSPEAVPYGEAHLRWRDDMGSQMQILECEQKKVGLIHGLEVGGTWDLKVRLGHRICLIERKCCATFHPAWRLQLAKYAMLDSGRSDCSIYGRAVVRYLATGRYAYNPIDPQWDATDSAVAIAFLQTYAWRKNHNLI